MTNSIISEINKKDKVTTDPNRFVFKIALRASANSELLAVVGILANLFTFGKAFLLINGIIMAQKITNKALNDKKSLLLKTI